MTLQAISRHAAQQMAVLGFITNHDAEDAYAATELFEECLEPLLMDSPVENLRADFSATEIAEFKEVGERFLRGQICDPAPDARSLFERMAQLRAAQILKA